jgi:hypothetical protein
MGIKVITLRLSFFVLLVMGGMLLAAVSVTPFPENILQAKGIRALGFFCLFLGIGEILNHPLQKRLAFNDQNNSGPHATLHRSRNPCGLGNTFDVLALICLFIALSYFFFPYRV